MVIEIFVSSKIRIWIPREYFGYMLWYAKRYISAVYDAYNFFVRELKKVQSGARIKTLDKTYRENISKLGSLLRKRHRLHVNLARKAVSDAYKILKTKIINRGSWNKKPILHPQISGVGIRNFGYGFELENKIFKLSVVIPNVKNGKIIWKFEMVPIKLKITRINIDRLKLCLEKKLKMAWRIIFKKYKKWGKYRYKTYMVLTIDYPDPYKLPEKQKVLGIDFNYNRITACLINEQGNPIYFKTIKLQLEHKSKEAVKRLISNALQRILNDLKYEEFTIAIEDLSGLRKYYSKKYKRRVVRYRVFRKIVESKAAKNSIPLRLVKPNYTSVISYEKYKHIYRGRSIHELAALIIARRLRFPVEKINKLDDKKLRAANFFGYIQYVPKK